MAALPAEAAASHVTHRKGTRGRAVVVYPWLSNVTLDLGLGRKIGPQALR